MNLWYIQSHIFFCIPFFKSYPFLLSLSLHLSHSFICPSIYSFIVISNIPMPSFPSFLKILSVVFPLLYSGAWELIPLYFRHASVMKRLVKPLRQPSQYWLKKWMSLAWTWLVKAKQTWPMLVMRTSRNISQRYFVCYIYHSSKSNGPLRIIALSTTTSYWLLMSEKLSAAQLIMCYIYATKGYICPC